jgi:hypothetical protein
MVLPIFRWQWNITALEHCQKNTFGKREPIQVVPQLGEDSG